MKKIFIALAALATIAACNKAEVVEATQGDAIAFGDAFVDNSTKAIYNEANDIQGFKVWGNVDGTNTTPVALYPDAGADVTRGSAGLGAAWTCTVARYWTPSASYNFVAIANGTGTELENGIPTEIAYTVNSTTPADLIYGATTAATDAYAVPTSGVNANKVVTFTMQHLLSRLQVSFENTLSSDYTFDVTDVTVTTWKDGVYTISSGLWAQSGSTTVNLVYGESSALAPGTPTPVTGDHLIIPGSEITLSFNYVLKLDGTAIYSTSTPVTKAVPLTAVKGNSYKLNVQIKSGNEITFSVSETNGLGAWTNADSSVIF